MEVAFLIIAIVGLLALSAGGNISGNLNVQPNQPIGGGNVPPGGFGSTNLPGTYGVGPGGFSIKPPVATPPIIQVGVASVQQPMTYSPSPAPAFNPPMAPSTRSNTTGALLTGSAAIGTSILTATVHLGAAAGPVGAAIAVAAAIAAALLAAHEKRLQDAKTENQAVDQWVPVFDSFISQVVQAYNSGRISAAQAAQICQQFDNTIYNKFRSFVGQPGTAWNDQVGMAGKCNKQCTVGCCLYFGDLGPPLNNISYVLGFPTGKWGQGDPRINGRTITIPKVYPSKYSPLTRDSYTVTLN